VKSGGDAEVVENATVFDRDDGPRVDIQRAIGADEKLAGDVDLPAVTHRHRAEIDRGERHW